VYSCVILYVYRANPDTLAGVVMAGNEHVSGHHYREALEMYLRAFRIDPHQPLTSLCVATTLAYIAVHPLTARKQDVCGKAVAFFSHYAQMRMLTGQCNGLSDVKMKSLQQEVFYNIGCFFTEIRLTHLAEDFFVKALQLFDDIVEKGDTDEQHSLPLTREAAFNLSIIYRKSGNERLAREVMVKHLNFDKTGKEAHTHIDPLRNTTNSKCV
jgi:general transcription factor 3C polypeptide 3 (transcription factor C subunit 4)